MIFGNRLRELREKQGLTQEELGEKLNLKKAVISKYENNKLQPSLETINYLAAYFGVTTDYLLGRTEIQELDVAGMSSFLPSDSVPLKQIPLYGRIPAGKPEMCVCEEAEEYIPVPQNINADFALEVRGDSMIGAGIFEGDIVICRHSCTAENGQIVAALINGDETTIKYLIKDEEACVLRAANPKYSDIHINPDDAIQGVVIKIEKAPPVNGKFISAYKELTNIPGIAPANWLAVAKEAEKYGISPEKAARLIRSFGKLMHGEEDEDDID